MTIPTPPIPRYGTEASSTHEQLLTLKSLPIALPYVFVRPSNGRDIVRRAS
jgi:hypothetical protein